MRDEREYGFGVGGAADVAGLGGSVGCLEETGLQDRRRHEVEADAVLAQGISVSGEGRGQGGSDQGKEGLRALLLGVCQELGYNYGRLSINHAAVLILCSEEPRSMSSLARSMIRDTAVMTPVIDDMEARGWVERVAHPTDRRSKLVQITDAGREKLETAIRNIQALASVA